MQGLDEVLKRIESEKKELAIAIDNELLAGARNVAVRAKANAPKGKSGELAASITYGKLAKYSYFVAATASYSPFVEFGTGIRVFKTPEFNFTPEMRAYARQFFVSGEGRLFPSPFLFPAYEYEKIQIVRRIKAVLFKDKRL